jgi:hypothetical protein
MCVDFANVYMLNHALVALNTLLSYANAVNTQTEATAPPGEAVVTTLSDTFSLGCLLYQMYSTEPVTLQLLTLRPPTPASHQMACSQLFV